MKKSKVTEEHMVSKIIIDRYCKRLKDMLSCEVAVVGGGPAGLVCSYYLAKKGIKVALFERKASLGGGIWGGGMMFNMILVQKELEGMFKEYDINYEQAEDKYLVTSAPSLVGSLLFAVCKAGVEVFNFISAEDLVVKKDKVCGLVLNWTAVEMAKLHVDPLNIDTEYVVDATGHECFVAKKLMQRKGVSLDLINDIHGEKFMNVDLGEKEVVENSKEIFPGLFVAGMSANAVFGGHRMGPIFGGMMLSGKKVAVSLINRLEKQ